ncbi:hypothetical protein FNJ88_08515 [Chryseobacterium sp. SNU WT5]|uniref:hypothetical protein n=1 Tax=Chryseobacterium sp. SNU WT5 TaxID=2594269 RepID=UPI00117E2D18|nr:hypothetical protein [Chryseobacterium sp. SNU WT5]QDP85604.1 hypothetical protein FNJ88_08515 [Chryseobacterium sp. SNU WT5]
MTFIPDNYKLTYKLNDVKKTFRQYQIESAEIPNLLPELVRTEKNNGFNSITGAENILKVRNATNWTKCSLAGLRPTGIPNFYYSDLPVNDVKSLIVAFIPDDWETVVLRVCKQFYPKGNPEYRNRLVKHLITNF